jgi:5-methyltetrahydrofolate--homocysteine methyltransferase
MPPLLNAKQDKQLRRLLRNCPSYAERVLWFALRKRQFRGWKFRRQQSIGAYIVDFWCPEARLAIEVDGGTYDVPEAAERDQQRQDWIERQGIKFFRCRNEDVVADLNGVLERLGAILSTPSPSSQRRGSKQQT